MKKELEKTKSLKEVVTDHDGFKKDMAKFYAVNPAATKNVELDQFVGQIGKENAEANNQRPMTTKSNNGAVVEQSERQSRA